MDDSPESRSKSTKTTCGGDSVVFVNMLTYILRYSKKLGRLRVRGSEGEGIWFCNFKWRFRLKFASSTLVFDLSPLYKMAVYTIYIYVNLHSASYISVFLIFSSTVCLEISISLLFMFFILNSSTSSPGSSHRSCLFHFASLKHIFIVFIFNSSPTSPGSSYRSCLFHSASF